MEIFTRKWSEISGGRFDPLYLYFNIQTLLKHHTFKLDKIGNCIVDIKTGFAAGKQYQADSGGIIQIRPTNLSENWQLKFDKNIYIPKNSVYISDYIRKGEVLFNNTNSQELVGKTAYFDLEGNFVCSNHITRIKTKENKLLPKYLWILLNIYQNKHIFFNTCVNWNNQSGVNIELLKSYTIPIPPKEIQEQIIDIMDNAYLLKNKKENEAKELLNSVDSYLLAELGIELPSKDISLEHRIYTTKLSHISGKRFDCEYHQSYYKALEEAIQKGKYKVAKICNLIDNVKDLSQPFDKKVIYVEIGDIEVENAVVDLKTIPLEKLPSNTKICIKQGDLLISTVRPNRKAVAIYEKNNTAYCTSAFCVLRENGKYKKELLQYLLRTNIFNALIVRNTTGSTYPTINNNDILNLKIPLPPLSVQEKITDEITKRKQKALNLQKEAKECLNSAKIQVEKIILGQQQKDERV